MDSYKILMHCALSLTLKSASPVRFCTSASPELEVMTSLTSFQSDVIFLMSRYELSGLPTNFSTSSDAADWIASVSAR